MSCLINQGSFRKIETSLGLETEGISYRKVVILVGGKGEKPEDRVEGQPRD